MITTYTGSLKEGKMQTEVFNLIDQKQKKYFDLLEKI